MFHQQIDCSSSTFSLFQQYILVFLKSGLRKNEIRVDFSGANLLIKNQKDNHLYLYKDDPP
jgi:hypothetical protein